MGKIKKTLVLFLITVFITVGYLGSSIANDDAVVVDKIAAVVGSKIILLSEVFDASKESFKQIEQTVASQGGSPMMVNQQKRQVVNQALQALIDDILVRLEAEAMKITVTTAEVERAFVNMARENGNDVETFEKRLKASGNDPMAFKAKLRKDVLKYKVLNMRVRGRVNITDQRARDYYNEQVRDVRATGSFEGAHILVKVPEGVSALEVKKLRGKADEIAKRLKDGEDFYQLAQQLSDDKVTAKYGGRLGVRKCGEIPPILDRAFIDMEPGELMGPVRTPAGYHILKLVSRESLGVQPFANVKPRIINQLMQEEMTRQQEIWLKELRLKTFIDVRM